MPASDQLPRTSKVRADPSSSPAPPPPPRRKKYQPAAPAAPTTTSRTSATARHGPRVLFGAALEEGAFAAAFLGSYSPLMFGRGMGFDVPNSLSRVSKPATSLARMGFSVTRGA